MRGGIPVAKNNGDFLFLFFCCWGGINLVHLLLEFRSENFTGVYRCFFFVGVTLSPTIMEVENHPK